MAVVATNTAANTAIRFLNFNTSQAGESIARLASGSRIVSASDDAAGLAISSRLSADVSVLQQAGTNAAQGASVLQVADGGLARIGDVLQRLGALAAQSLSGVPSDAERAFIDAEFTQLTAEINGIVDSTTFNGQALLNGTAVALAVPGSEVLSFLVGTDASTDTIAVDLDSDLGLADFTTAATGLNLTIGVDTAANAATALGEVNTAIDGISAARANVGAITSRFEFRGQQIATSIENIQAANSSIKDVDIAAEQSALVSSQVLVQAAVSALTQANQIPQTLLRVLQ